jgi:4-amino-4-deoxy-L-arabinose transferase-like glycosyltransferase
MIWHNETGNIPLQNDTKTPFYHNTRFILFLILVVASLFRLVKLGQISPPGLNQDEAAAAWNAYCLLKTGKDQVGDSWPIFWMHGLGGKPTTLHVYALLPFQFIGGMNILTTRLPAAVGGIFTVFLIYFAGKRLFDKQIALLAAGLLAIDPWQIQQSRWGQDAALCALWGIAPLAAMLWANLPVSDDENAVPRPVYAALAGVITGIVCYGYHAVRLFVPAFLVLTFLVTLPGWWRILKTRKGLLAVAAFGITFAATFGPLVWQQIFHSERMARPDQYQRMVFALPLPAALKEIGDHYIAHFGLDFLFIHGDHNVIQSPPGIGLFHWYMLPLMISGLIFLIYRFRHSFAARILLVCILIYPVGDCFNQDGSPHALRSLPSLCGLVLLAAVGTVVGFRWLQKQNRNLATALVAIFVIAAVVLNIRYFYHFYGEYNRRPEIYHGYHADLVEAGKWLRPRFNDFDAVFWTTEGTNMPYIITLVVLGYDPEQWLREPREGFRMVGYDDFYSRYGKMHFMYGQSLEPAMNALPPNPRVLVIVRPGELGLKNPIHQIYRPDGTATLWMCQP